jgi:hypothetical protein
MALKVQKPLVESRRPEHLLLPQQAKVRNWANQISEIKTPEGEILKDFNQIKQQASMHFQNLYTTSGRAENQIIEAFLNTSPVRLQRKDNTH